MGLPDLRGLDAAITSRPPSSIRPSIPEARPWAAPARSASTALTKAPWSGIPVAARTAPPSTYARSRKDRTAGAAAPAEWYGLPAAVWAPYAAEKTCSVRVARASASAAPASREAALEASRMSQGSKEHVVARRGTSLAAWSGEEV